MSARAASIDQSLTQERISHALVMFAKLLCSGVFVVGRDADEFLEHDVKTHVRPEGVPFDWNSVEIAVDHNERLVTLSALGISRMAKCHAGQGCTIIPEGERDVRFSPMTVEPIVPDSKTTPWPMGDLLADEPLPDNVDTSIIETTLDWAFDDQRQTVPQNTRAMIIVHKDRIIGERYAPGFNSNTRHISWSMGKMITGALGGLLVKDGHLNLDDPAPIEQWQEPGDPRVAITVSDLLRMSSGLKSVRAQDDERLEWGWTHLDDHMYVYYGAVDVFEHSISRPLEHSPGTFWRYRNCDSLTLGKIIRQTVEAIGENYLTFPQRALFDRIGIQNMVLEPDPWGNFIMTGYNYGTARDWARFGLLHLHNGVWPSTGDEILTKDWIDFVRTPAPAAAEQQYGGQFRLNASARHPDIPRDAFWHYGGWGQVTMIIPSRDIVFVRLGHSPFQDASIDPYVNRVVGDILRAVGASSR